MPVIEIKNLVKQFKGTLAVNDLSFEVGENKVFGFLGPNGAGKTTTIRIMAGLSKASSGEVCIDGKKVVFGETDTNKLIGYLPEQPAFYSWMTGLEYLNFIGNIFEIKPLVLKKKIDELLGLVDLKEAANKRIGAYSNGMKQRLGIAQALINDPKVLILDEPVSALDPIGRKEVLSIIENLKKSKTIFISTHILSDVDRICDDIAILDNGKLLAISSLAKLKEEYAKPILEIDFSHNPEELIKLFNNEAWANKVEKNGNQLRIFLDDDKAVETNLPLKILSKSDIGVLRYGLVLPETEELFVQMVEKERQNV